MAESATQYDESKVKTLSSLEHIRLRPGMYIGRMGNGSHADDGIYVLLKEVIDNSVDEFIMGHGKHVEINVDEQRCRVRDFGRGIPLGKLVPCVSQINTGAKFNDEVFQFSVGLNGVGTKAVNALAEHFAATAYRDGKYKRAVFSRGELLSEEDGETDEPNGTAMEFIPDRELFPRYKFDPKIIRRRMWNYAYLNSGLTLVFNGEKILSRNGLYDLLKDKVGDNMVYDIVHHREKQLEFAFTHTTEFGENYSSFVNGQYTNDGGTHQSAFREGILKAVNEYARKNYEPDDVRNGIFGAIAIKLQEPVFESQTKNKLGNQEIRSDLVQKVKESIVHFLHQNKEVADIILEKVSQNEKLRKEIQAVKKASRDKAKKLSIKNPKLKDCKHHRGDKRGKGDNSQIFICEGDSAAGSMISARDPMHQALFPLKGKPLNVYGKKRDVVVSNDELFCLTHALGIDDGLEGLRYEKVIIATDADDDGMHIRNLVLTFFLYLHKDLILADHLYILETPLYRVRDKNRVRYCYDEEERDAAIAELGAKHQLTRFKGLGEISGNEMKHFIGPDIRLVEVGIEQINEVPQLLDFFMGSNTPERRDFIVENMV